VTDTRPPMDRMAVVVGALRCASGISFLVAPEAANRLWGDAEDPDTTASLLLRSMGYRDALVGGLLLGSALNRRPSTAAWFLASAGADAADLLGGLANHHRMTRDQQLRGLGGAVVGITVGVLGALRSRARTRSFAS
jgi:hypothetical protein